MTHKSVFAKVGSTPSAVVSSDSKTQWQSQIMTNANNEVIDENGRTELFTSALSGDGARCRLLLEQGADIHHVDRFGYSATGLAQDKNLNEIADFLQTVKQTKWRPGLHPKLMEEVDYDVVEKSPFERLHVREISAVEILLEAVKAEKYLPIFLKHKVTYVQLLNFDDSLLREIGVEEVDIRQKILDHIDRIHKSEFRGSLCRNELRKKSGFSAEVLCILVNMEDHLIDVSSTMGYITHRAERTPQDLKFDLERNRMEDIIQLSKKTADNANELGRDARSLHNAFGRLLGYAEDDEVVNEEPREHKVERFGAKYFSIKNILLVGVASMGLLFMLKVKRG